MNKEELLQRLEDIEWEDFEVKTAKNQVPKSCWETVSSFSNTAGGWMVFGVRQKGKSFEIVGVDHPEKLEQDFLNTLNGQKFNIKIRPVAKRYNLDGKQVFAFYIPVAKQKPVYYNSLSNTFIRTGSGDIRATKEEIDAMYRDQSFGTKSGEVIDSLTIDSISSVSINRYMEYMGRFNPTLSYNRLSREEFLHKTQVLIDDKVTYAGLLVFGKQDDICRCFNDFRIDLLEIPGTSYHDAPIRFTYRMAEQENLWEYYFALFERITQKVDKPFAMTQEGFAVGSFPHVEALREALVNMLMHADYFSPMKSRVRIFTDRIEFMNPGCFPKPVGELIKSDISIPRNPIIAKLFRLVKLAENAGFGFDKMINGWKSYSPKVPVFQNETDYSVVTFFEDEVSIDRSEKRSEKKVGENLTANQIKILSLLKTKPNMSAKELAEHVGISSRKIEQNIAKLKQWGLLKRIGPAKGGHWELAK
ncbi:MAG: HTH domain-containing protein [Planctomycetes bacterium]|nr:HTH domain-containing protein [Planctomycetota bacterium]